MKHILNQVILFAVLFVLSQTIYSQESDRDVVEALNHKALSAEHPFFASTDSVMTLPYIEDFDSYTTDIAPGYVAPDAYPNHTLPDYWTFLGLDNHYPKAFLSSDAQYASSHNCLLFSSSSAQYIYAVLPKMEKQVDSLSIKFTYRNEGTSAANSLLSVGVMSNPHDESTFILLETFPISAVKTNAEHYFFRDSILEDSVAYHIAFRYGGGPYRGYFLGLDNVVVEQDSVCQKPQRLLLDSVGTNQAKLSWTGYASNYELNYKKSVDSRWNRIFNASTTVVLNSLTEQSSYDIRVRAICGEGDTSEWSEVLSIETECTDFALPYVEDFDNYTTDIAPGYVAPDAYPNHTLPTDWIFPILGDHTPKAFLSSSADYASSQNCLLFSSSNTQYIYAVLPKMGKRVDSLYVSFIYRNEGESLSNSLLSVGVITNPHDANSFLPLETFPISVSKTEIEHYFSMDTILEDSVEYYIAFRYGGGPYSGYFLGLDNVLIDTTPSCIKPLRLTLDSVGAHGAQWSWEGYSSNYEVSYKPTSLSDWTSYIVASSHTQLSNLNPSTAYDIKVRAIDEEGDTSRWSNVSNFSTECVDYPLPYVEDFSTWSDLENIDCWKFYRGLVDEVVSGTASLLQKRPNFNNWKLQKYDNMVLNIYGVTCKDWLVTPQIDLSHNANLSFKVAFVDGDGDMPATDFEDDKFYVMITTNNGTSWNELITWGSHSSNSYPMDSLSMWGHSISIPLSAYRGQFVRIAFYGESTVEGGDNNLFLDDIAITIIDTCSIPNQLNTDSITYSTAQFQWLGSSQTYQLEYANVDSLNWHSLTVEENNYRCHDLHPSTQYQWRVKSICSELDTSNWSDMIQFRTQSLLPATGVSVNQITAHSAEVLWDDNSEAIGWEIKYQNIDSNYAQCKTEQSTLNSCHLSNLSPNSNYQLSIRAKYAGGYYSEWSDSVLFQTLALESIYNYFSLTVFPNPVHDVLTIRLTGVKGDCSISIIDINGKELFKEYINCNSYYMRTMKLHHWVQGLYFLRILGPNIDKIDKFMVI